MSTDWAEISEEATDERKGYLSTDEFDDVLASLELLRDCLKMVSEEPWRWKWAILSTHSALQGACVCFLTRTDGGGALTKNSEKALSEYHSRSTQKAIVEAHDAEWVLGNIEYPEREEVAPFPELLRRLPIEIRVDFPHKNQETKDDVTKDFVRLHQFRNQFTHFPSVGWSLELAGIPRILKCALGLVRKIAQRPDYKRYNRFLDMDLEAVLKELKAILDRLD